MQVGLRDTIEARAVGRFQMAVIFMITLISIFDGLDLQWTLTTSQFAPIIAAALVGMAAGTLIGVWLGDRIGRRRSLQMSVLVFGLATLGCAFAGSVPELVIMRFIGALGFGAAFPVGTALATEWMSRRWAGPAVISLTLGIPLGGLIGAAIAAQLLPLIGWRACFLIFGAVPTAYSLLLLVALPESPAYLVQKDDQIAVCKLLARAFGATVERDSQYRLPEESGRSERILPMLLGSDLTATAVAARDGAALGGRGTCRAECRWHSPRTPDGTR